MKRFIIALLLFVPVITFGQFGTSSSGNGITTLSDTSSVSSAGKIYYYSGNYYAGNSSGTYDIIPSPPTGSIADGYVPIWNATTKTWGVGSQGSGAHLQADWISNYTASKDTIGFKAAPKFHPMGNYILYDRTASQYSRYTGTELSIRDNDVIDAFWIKTTNVTSNTQDISGYGAMDGIWLYGSEKGASYDGKIYRQVFDGGVSNYIGWLPSKDFRDGYLHFIVIVVRQLKYFYCFLDGKFDRYLATSNNITMPSSPYFDVGGDMDSGYLSGSLDEYRRFLQGKEGIYATGTGRTDLELRVGGATGDVIYTEVYPYSPANPGGMIPEMYKNPSVSLSDIGFYSLEDADRTERHDGSGNVTGLVVGDWYAFDQGTSGHNLSGCVTNPAIADTIFQATATTGTISSGDANDSVKRIGEVAHYKMNESGTPSTLVDETSNNLDLTTYGTPAMEANDYENLSIVRANIDTVFADTANIRAADFTDVYLGDRSSAPGAGTAKSLLYSASGEIYAHDAAGNNTLISPHFGGDWVFNSWNSNNGKRIFINLFDLAKSVQALTGKKFIYRDTVAVQVPAKVAADTLYRMVYDSLTQRNTKIMIVRAKRGFYKRNGKFYKIEKSRISEPPDAYKKDNPTGLGKRQ